MSSEQLSNAYQGDPGASPREPDDVDRHVGRQLRNLRKLRGLSQTDLAKAIGLSFQQVQKYERGVNRMGAGRLCQFAQTLGVSVRYFFEGVDPADREDGDNAQSEVVVDARDLRLIHALHNLRDGPIYDAIEELVLALDE